VALEAGLEIALQYDRRATALSLATTVGKVCGYQHKKWERAFEVMGRFPELHFHLYLLSAERLLWEMLHCDVVKESGGEVERMDTTMGEGEGVQKEGGEGETGGALRESADDLWLRSAARANLKETVGGLLQMFYPKGILTYLVLVACACVFVCLCESNAL